MDIVETSSSTTAAPFSVDFDVEGYCQRRAGEVRPRQAFDPPQLTPELITETEATLRELATGSVLPAGDGLAHPGIRPGACYEEVWDWDAFFAGVGPGAATRAAWHGSLELFLERIRDDGCPTMLVSPAGAPWYGGTAMPLQAQWSVLVARERDGWDWLRPHWPRLLACREWYDRERGARRGFYRLVHRHGMGIDNDPACHLRANGGIGAVHVNVCHQRELAAMALIAARLGEAAAARAFTARATELAEAIRTFMYDPIDGFFYHLDLAEHGELARQGATWELPYKIRSCAGIWPLWAGLASDEQARRVIEGELLQTESFLASAGLRSLSKRERMYNNVLMGNPSNWQGPVWGLSTVLGCYALARYGYRDAALDVAQRFLATLAGDIMTNGCLHECYHGDTGTPVMKPGFCSWNLLACGLVENVKSGVDPLALEQA